MRRVVVTGMGIVSCLGNNKEEVLASLQAQKSGIQFVSDYKEQGLRSHIAGRPNIDLDAHINRKLKRFMGDSSAYAYLSLQQAIADAGLNDEQVSSLRTGIVAGSGGAGCRDIVEAVDTLREKYATYKDETENFLDGLDDKLDQIKNDDTLKSKMKKYSKDRAMKMATNVVKMDENLDKLEVSITKGNNLIIALETVSSFNELAQDIKDFDMLLDSSSKIFTEIDTLIVEGTSVLDDELK